MVRDRAGVGRSPRMVETLASGYGLVEGPTVDEDGNLYFSDVLGGDAMQPDGMVARDHLAVDGLSVASTLDAAAAEPECVDEEVVRALDVLVHEERDDALDRRHGATVARSCTEVH